MALQLENHIYRKTTLDVLFFTLTDGTADFYKGFPLILFSLSWRESNRGAGGKQVMIFPAVF